ncbi:MAG: HlyC/CorC family transporter [Halioglobus sp.]|nr:HlyC/CorC family transporter [Halioglobus sp.]
MNEAPLGMLFSILAALVIASAFFSSAETAMMTLNRHKLRHLQKNKIGGAVRAGKLLDRPDRLIGLILIGNNLVNIFASAVATVISIRLWGDAGVYIATGTLTVVILVFAEVTPKTIAALHPERVAFPASVILLPLMALMSPVVAMVNAVTNRLSRLLGFDPKKEAYEHVSADELRTIVTDAGNLIPARHRELLINIMDLVQVSVDDIMVPRNEVYGINLDNTDQEILLKIQSTAHTRLPVWRDDINNIIGVLHMRSISRVVNGLTLNRVALEREMEKPYFVPESTPLHTQLINFQEMKKPLAFVVDEYGEVRGVVALGDILEEIVGDFTSNMAETAESILLERDGSYIIDGTENIRDINKTLGWNLPKDGPKTLSGLILEYLESFPAASVGLTIENYRLEILELEGNVVRSVRAQPFA